MNIIAQLFVQDSSNREFGNRNRNMGGGGAPKPWLLYFSAPDFLEPRGQDSYIRVRPPTASGVICFVRPALSNSLTRNMSQSQNLVCDHWAAVKKRLKVPILEPTS
jgi:hypothetical protein